MTVFDIDRRAPAIGIAATTIDAPIGRVWDRLVAISDWPHWNPAVTRVRLSGPVRLGTRFDWTAGGLPIRSCIEGLDPCHFIGWTGTAPMIRARHVYHLSGQGGMTRVETAESFTGPLAWLLPSLCSRIITASLEQGLAALKSGLEPGSPGQWRGPVRAA